MISFPEAPWKLAYRPKYVIAVNYFCVRERRMFCILALSLSFNSLADKFSRRRKKRQISLSECEMASMWWNSEKGFLSLFVRFMRQACWIHWWRMQRYFVCESRICTSSSHSAIHFLIRCQQLFGVLCMRPAIWCTMVDGPMQLLDMDTFTRSHTVHIMKSSRQIFS